MTQNANEQLRESLSALADNQAGELELRRLIKALESDECLAANWRRYHLAGEIMRGAKPMNISLDISAAVAAAVAEEKLHSVGAKSRWQNVFGKSALAASVALAVLLGAKQFTGAPASAPLASAPAVQDGNMQVVPGAQPLPVATAVASLGEATPTQEAPAGFALPLPDARTVSTNGAAIRHSNGATSLQPIGVPNQNWRNDAQLQQELNQLLIDHAARASGNGSLGILPFARVSSMNGTQTPKE